jgi:hypothetical protein
MVFNRYQKKQKAMKAKNIYLLLAMILVGLSGCAVTDFDRSANFSKYKTFGWGKSDVKVSNPLYESDLINKRIKAAVEEEFAKRGIVKAEADPDVIVRYHTYTEEKERTSGGYPYSYRFFPYAFYPFGFGWWGLPLVSPQTTTQYTEGTLIVDIIDNRTNDLIWRGSVTGDVKDVSGIKKQIEKGVRAIMKKYPVSPEMPLDLGQDEKAIS